MTKKIIALLLTFALLTPLAQPVRAAGTGKPNAPASFKATNGMARQIDITFAKVQDVDGYQIAVSTDRKFAKNKTSTLTHKGNQTGQTSKALENIKGHSIRKHRNKSLILIPN